MKEVSSRLCSLKHSVTKKRLIYNMVALVVSITMLLSSSASFLIADSSAKTPDSYSYQEDLSISSNVSITSSWGDHANLLFEIKNSGEKTIHNWFVSFDLPYEMEGIWEANLIEHQNGMYTIMNGGYNMDILPNQKVSFGMTVKSKDGSAVTELPTFMFLNTNTFELELSSLSLQTKLYSDWGQGCNGNLTLVSNVDFPIMDWTIRFTSNRPITSVSNAVLTQDEEGVYTLTNNGNNANIEGHTSLPLSFNGGAGKGLQLTLLSVRTITYPMTLSQDENQNGIADILEKIGQGQQQEDPDIDLELDTDGDCVPDYYEKQIGTDPNSKDSDSDGINDGVEIALGMDPLVTDSDNDGIPDAQEDDDGDGLTLIEEIEHETYTWTNDSDVDGISDGGEIHVYGTDPRNEDTDGDGIEDGDELKLGLDPKSSDSDGNGVGDGQERFPQTRSEVIEDAERPAVNQVDVALTGTGCLDSAMKIKDMYGEDAYCSDLVSLVGAPVSIEYEGEFDEATITFHYDESKITRETMNLEDSTCDEEFREEDLGILWFDEETGLFVDYEATVDTVNNTVSCKTTHFSEYMLYWKTAWNYRWKYELQRPGLYNATNLGENGQARGRDYALLIQYDATMTDEQRETQRKIVFDFIDNMRPNDRIQFVDWSYNWVFGPWAEGGNWNPLGYSDKNVLKQYYDNLMWSGDRDSDFPADSCPFTDKLMQNGEVGWIFVAPHLNGRINFISSQEIVSICFQNVLVSSKESGAMISSGMSVLSRMGYPSTYLFELPGGSYSSAAENLFDANSRGGLINCDIVDDPYEEFCRLYLLNQGADSDGDGLLDIAETVGMVGTNGEIYYSDPDTEDSDHDGLTDREEMGDEIKLSVDQQGNVTVENQSIDPDDPRYLRFVDFGVGDWVIYHVVSDPKKIDTDGDGVNDNVDYYRRLKNPFISYCFASDDHFGLALFWQRYEEKVNQVRCEVRVIYSASDLKEKWSGMGLEDEGTSQYKIFNVHLNFHGAVGEINTGYGGLLSRVRVEIGFMKWMRLNYSDLIGSGEQVMKIMKEKWMTTYDLICIDQLARKNINGILYLDMCESGNTNAVSTKVEDYDADGNNYTNCAVAFLEAGIGVSEVRAWDGNLGAEINEDGQLLNEVYSRINGETKNEHVIYSFNGSGLVFWRTEYVPRLVTVD